MSCKFFSFPLLRDSIWFAMHIIPYRSVGRTKDKLALFGLRCSTCKVSNYKELCTHLFNTKNRKELNWNPHVSITEIKLAMYTDNLWLLNYNFFNVIYPNLFSLLFFYLEPQLRFPCTVKGLLLISENEIMKFIFNKILYMYFWLQYGSPALKYLF